MRENMAFFAGVDYKRVDPDSTSRRGADEILRFAQYDDHPGPRAVMHQEHIYLLSMVR